jgi:hypothetical protein
MFGSQVPRGTNIFDEEWELCIILDACRVDALCEVSSDYGFIANIEERWSVGSMSEEWMKKTFSRTENQTLLKTAYVTSNVFSKNVLHGDQFLLLEEVWKYGSDSESKVTLPRAITDRAVDIHRELEPDRLLVHYMQPHHPFVGEVSSVSEFKPDPFGEKRADTVVDAYRKGEVPHEKFWGMYMSNLRLVLNDVELLLENIDAESVLITSDHGEAMGEWWVHGHPAGFLHPVVAKVPWTRTSATDHHTHEPKNGISESEQISREDQLKALGYK